ncbi:Wyosine base formation domain protein [Ignisphaera aggregans DSM 17230]|uniref:S-adenosyl-L-methionine-dependent tRNA 4-demethylwyosine synthase n=1 Tax=Ignisphaera aggregans (strain DSM 17230 / JCM 13409 / AQ1.S1) TaxID=583356 RepID=E0SP26_IGNAA|nr:Wyosine base formation domain protein [Ignisphaera aggregans DSM 17230]
MYSDHIMFRLMKNDIDPITQALDILRKQKYHLIGNHSAVKKCYWVHKAITEGMFCYKAKFYGIESHRCIQFSPSVLWCWNYCLHCWRYRSSDSGENIWHVFPSHVDDPRFLVDMAIKEHRRTVSGYKRYPNVDKRIYEEALNPKHVAISLTGEPTLYPRIDDLIEEFHKKGMTTFLVTRGVRPEILANLRVEPTQLYVSLEAFDEESYRYFNNPISPQLWRKTLETLEILPSFTSPTVIRITLIRSFNMHNKAIDAWSKIIERSQPTFIEVKAYMHIGASITRLSRDDMPNHYEVKRVAEELSKRIGYNIVSESIPSRVVLLSKLDRPIIRYGNPPISWSDIDKGDENSGEYGELSPP